MKRLFHQKSSDGGKGRDMTSSSSASNFVIAESVAELHSPSRLNIEQAMPAALQEPVAAELEHSNSNSELSQQPTQPTLPSAAAAAAAERSSLGARIRHRFKNMRGNNSHSIPRDLTTSQVSGSTASIACDELFVKSRTISVWGFVVQVLLCLFLIYLAGKFDWGGGTAVIFVGWMAVSARSTFMRWRTAMLKDAEYLALRRLTRDGETVSWLNNIIQWIVDTYQPQFEQFFQDAIIQQLQGRLPPGISNLRVKKLYLGSHAPLLSGVSTRRTEYGLELDAHLNWTVPDAELTISVSVQSIPVPIRLSSVYIDGPLHMAISLQPNSPYVSKVSVNFVREPSLDFKLEPLLALDLMALPLLSTWLTDTIDDSISRSLVYDKVVIDLSNTNDSEAEVVETCKSQSTVGMLHVSFLAAEAVPLKEGRVVLSLCVGPNWVRTLSTQPVKKFPNPVFCDESFTLLVRNEEEDKLFLRMFAKNLLSPDREIGRIELDPKEYLRIAAVSNGDPYTLTLDSGIRVSCTIDYQSMEVESCVEQTLVSLHDGGIVQVEIFDGDFSDIFGRTSPDLFVIVSCNNNIVLRTRIEKKTAVPNWDQSIDIFIPCIFGTRLVLTVKESTFGLFSEVLGEVALDLGTIFAHGTKPGLQQVTVDSDGRGKGQLNVGLTLKPVNLTAHLEKRRSSVNLTSQNASELPLAQIPEAIAEDSSTTESCDCPVEVEPESVSFLSAVREKLRRNVWNPQDQSSVHVMQANTKSKTMMFKRSETFLHKGEDMVTIRLNYARDLKSGDIASGLSDPFVEVKYNKKLIYKSTRRFKTLNPEWNEECHIYLKPYQEYVVYFIVKDYDMLKRNDFLGSCHVEIDERFEPGKELTFDLKLSGGVHQGLLNVSMRRITPALLKRMGSLPTSDTAETAPCQ